ncbi:uncharacterized protein LOC123538202 [Mercenaria mercenaria]|uniref:uncharacterized protein LOC123538202 n=1 Tax=Mercenaria mercenaria TaxID=6596 RepID=UPI00234E432F|nr:uncharacterized protein LOC123538202 [Mercenaria mercenaria]
MKLYKDGVDISGSDVKLTDLVTMTIQVDDEYIEDFDIKAKSCTANFIDITQDFCATDTGLFPNFVHVTQGVVTSTFGAFRTTDLGGGFVEMVFTCTVQVCRGLCTEELCGGESSWGRKKREADEDVAFEDLNVGTSMSVGTDNDLTPTDKDADESVCIAHIPLILGLLAISLVLFTSMGLTTFATGKLMKRTEELRKLSSDHEAERQKLNSKLRTERKQSISGNDISREAVTVKTLQSANCKITTKNTITISERNTFKPESSVSVNSSPHEINIGGSLAKSVAKSEKCPTAKNSKTFDGIPAASQLLEQI